ncbi:coat protein [Eimeriavirus ni]|uniref:Coat protein n=1 Tax=Eimeria stiedai RNA virus 1 TaxID=1898175 RepID=A0A1C9C4J3_9VIRU|nr:coat protein [Eimeria stiedai RNA virus 1]AOM63179.1 coat protein [Eimeria stiedai RNA virus 1]
MAERLSGLSAPAQEVTSICSNRFTSPPKTGECRVYQGMLELSWHAWGKVKRNDKLIRYEVGCRFDATGERKDRELTIGKKVTKSILGGYPFPTLALFMPADYQERLLRVEPRHTARPNWECFDFTGPVAMLAAWLSALTWIPHAATSHFVDTSSISLVPITNLEDSAALSQNNVFISQNVCGRGGSGAYWALVAACSACGATVATDRVIMAGPDTPRFYSAAGYHLWRDVLDALRILGELYDRAGGGEVFAYAFTKGIHSVSTVVAHSDEGGLMRDILRERRFAIPFGGLPAGCGFHPGMPTLAKGAEYRHLARLVDAYLLQTAAAVAHCAPLVYTGLGTSCPSVAYGRLAPEYQHQKRMEDFETPFLDASTHAKDVVSARTQHVEILRQALEHSFFEFGALYLPAIASFWGFSPTGEREQACRQWPWDALGSVLDDCHNRHLIKGESIAPFFWIEPTSILPHSWRRTACETDGWASMGGPGESRRIRMFPQILEDPDSSFTHRYYLLGFQGARKCPWLWALNGHREDGLAQVRLRVAYPEDFLNLGGRAAKEGPTAVFSEQAPISDYLWVRGQNPLPHPAEFLNTGETIGVEIKHFDLDKDHWLKAMPSPNEIREAVLDLVVSAPQGLRVGKSNTETRQEIGYRTAGARAMHRALAEVAADMQSRPTVGEARIERLPAYFLPGGGGGTGTVTVSRGGLTSAPMDTAPGDAERPTGGGPPTASVDVGTVRAVHAKRLAPTLAAGTHTGPRLPHPQAVSGGPAPMGPTATPPARPGDDSTADFCGGQDGGAATGTAPQAP